MNNIKEGDTAYWKYTKTFGIVTRVAVRLGDDPISITICWSDIGNTNVKYFTYNTGDLAKDGQLVIGKLTRLLYGRP